MGIAINPEMIKRMLAQQQGLLTGQNPMPPGSNIPPVNGGLLGGLPRPGAPLPPINGGALPAPGLTQPMPAPPVPNAGMYGMLAQRMAGMPMQTGMMGSSPFLSELLRRMQIPQTPPRGSAY